MFEVGADRIGAAVGLLDDDVIRPGHDVGVVARAALHRIDDARRRRGAGVTKRIVAVATVEDGVAARTGRQRIVAGETQDDLT